MANNENYTTEEQAVKKWKVRDKHGHVKKSGSLAVVGEVNIEVDSTGGDHPTADSTYQNGQLGITFHDIKGERGNGITSIDVEESSVDGGDNIVHIHCTDDEEDEGTELRVKNGSRGNGITSIEVTESQEGSADNIIRIHCTDDETEEGTEIKIKNGNGIASVTEETSSEDGGVNTHTFTDTNGNTHEIHTRNGTQGKQGDSAIWDENEPHEKLTDIANDLGDSTVKPISQKTVTEEILKRWYNLADVDWTDYIANNYYILTSTGKWSASLNSAKCALIPVSVTGTDKLIIFGNSERAVNYAFLTSNTITASGNVSYVEGTSLNEIAAGSHVIATIPTGTAYVYVSILVNNLDKAPSSMQSADPFVQKSIGEIAISVEKTDSDLHDAIGFSKAHLDPSEETYTVYTSFPTTNVAALDNTVDIHSICAVIENDNYDEIDLEANDTYMARAAFATAYNSQTITFCTPRTATATKSAKTTTAVPYGCKYIILTLVEAAYAPHSNDRTPKSITLRRLMTPAKAERLDNIENAINEVKQRIKDTLGDSLGSRFALVSNKLCKYVLTLCDTNYSGAVSVATNNNYGTSLFNNPLNIANTAVSLAKLLASNLLDDSIITRPKSEIEVYVHKLVMALANNHMANATPGWGNAWQSPLVAGSAANCVMLCEDLFSSAEKETIQAMVLSECDYVLGITSASDLYWKAADGTVLNQGDSKIEECYWNAMPLGAALVLCPEAENYDDIAEAFVRLNVIGGATSQDIGSWKVLNGYALSDLQGYNVEDNGIVINHQRIHPHYMVAMECSIFETFAAMAFKGYILPKAVLYGKDRIAKALYNVDFVNTAVDTPYIGNGGTIYQHGAWNIYYPEDNDWSPGMNKMTINEAAFDKCIKEMGIDPSCDWDAWASLHLSLPEYLQNRHLDGHLYEDGDTTAAANRRELSACQQVTTTLIFLKKRIKTTTSDDWATEDHYAY